MANREILVQMKDGKPDCLSCDWLTEYDYDLERHSFGCNLEDGIMKVTKIEDLACISKTCPLLKGAITVRLNTTDSSETKNE